MPNCPEYPAIWLSPGPARGSRRSAFAQYRPSPKDDKVQRAKVTERRLGLAHAFVWLETLFNV